MNTARQTDKMHGIPMENAGVVKMKTLTASSSAVPRSAEIESIANMLEHSGVQPYVEVRHLYIAQTLTYAKSSPKQVHQIGTYKSHYVLFPSRSMEHTV